MLYRCRSRIVKASKDKAGRRPSSSIDNINEVDASDNDDDNDDTDSQDKENKEQRGLSEGANEGTVSLYPSV